MSWSAFRIPQLAVDILNHSNVDCRTVKNQYSKPTFSDMQYHYVPNINKANTYGGPEVTFSQLAFIKSPVSRLCFSNARLL